MVLERIRRNKDLRRTLARRIRRLRDRCRKWYGTRVLRNHHVGARSSGRGVVLRGDRLFRKQFRPGQADAIQRELLARDVFAGRPWILPVLKHDAGILFFPELPQECRLDRVAQTLARLERFEVARQAMEIMFEMFMRGFAHRDFHSKNLFWVEGRLVVIDFESMGRYGDRPAFPESYDVVGRGMPSPYQTHNACYQGGVNLEVSLQQVLGVPTADALDMLRARLLADLHDTSLSFQALDRRHRCTAQLTYGSFALPHLHVAEKDAQRRTARRFERFGINTSDVKGRTFLDLGSNIGAIAFEMQKLGAAECVGVEIDSAKVHIANEVAGFNGLNHVRFEVADLEQVVTAPHADLTADIVSCLAVIEHVRNKDALYAYLGSVTRELLLFEGNSGTDPDVACGRLRSAGFRIVEFLGFSDDEQRAANNIRPMIVARK